MPDPSSSSGKSRLSSIRELDLSCDFTGPNPRLIDCAITGFARTGRYRHLPGYGENRLQELGRQGVI